MDLSTIETFVKSLDSHGLQLCQNLVNQALNKRPQQQPKDFIDYYEKFVEKDSVNDAAILAEIESLAFKTSNAKSELVQNKFISSCSQPYIWNSGKGPVVNEPLALDNFPGIRELMNQINSTYGYKLNCVLVSCLANGLVSVRPHDDNEDCLDQTQPICVVSYGASRRVEFISKQSSNSRRSDFTVEPEDRSLYVMKPGCQNLFRHRVRRDHNIQEHRYSLSFRCFIPDTDKDTEPAIKTKPPSLVLPTSTPNFGDAPAGFSPFPGQDTITPSGFDNSAKGNGNKICLLFGSSVTTGVVESRMKRGSRELINLSKSGARVCDLNQLADEFCTDHPDLIYRVVKIIVNIGTNDVKWFNGKRFSVHKRCYNPLISLITLLKVKFPLAVITFIPMLPIRALYNYTAKTVHDFNLLLLEVCQRYGCIFFDCFGDFLSNDYRDYNSNLFRDKWHPNEQGLALLCRAIKCIIFGTVVSSQVRCFWHLPYYS